jgi:hypothetical protein
MSKSLGLIAGAGLGLALLFFILAGTMSRGISSPAAGHPDTRQWAWEGGDRFEVRVPSKVRLIPGGPPAVIVHGDSEILKQLDFHDGMLEGADLGDCLIMIFCPERRSRVDIEVRGVSLNEFDISGVADVELGHLEQDRLKLRVSGAGNIEGDGHVGNLDLSISGAGNANLGEMAADRVRVNLSGAGNAEIAPSEEANVTISGVGHVGLATTPKSLTKHISGVGSVDGAGADRHDGDSGRRTRMRQRQQEHAQEIADRMREKVKEKLKKQGL